MGRRVFQRKIERANKLAVKRVRCLEMKLEDKVAVVTGSVRGLGWEIAHAYAQEGAKVTIWDLDQSLVDKAVERLGLAPERVLGVKADVSVEEDVINSVQRVMSTFHTIDVWVNNAGFAWPREGPWDLEIVDVPFQAWLKILGTNLNGVFLCSREALKIMRPQGRGSIINISSEQGKRGDPLRGPYCASKFGVEGLTQSMARENASYGVRINALDPGGRVAVERQRQKPSNKGQKMLSPDVIRPCAVYLASNESSNVTGQSLNAREWNQQHGIEVRYVEI